MTLSELKGLPVGAEVRVTKSGKVYRLYHIETEAQYASYLDGSEQGMRTKAYLATYRAVSFRQVRANSKGEIVLYGPVTSLKPENISIITSEVTA